MSNKPRFTSDPLAEQRAAVVEAAKSWADSTKNGIPVQGSPQDILRQAVNALSAAERPQEATLRECKCGATPTMTQGTQPPCRMAQVVCENCGRRGPNCWTVATAAAAWHARPERGDARAVIGELAQAGKHFQQKTVAFYEAAKENGYATAWGRDVGTKFVEAETRWNAAKAAAEALVKGAG